MEMKKELTKQQKLVNYIIEHFSDKEGNVLISNLDFSSIKGDLYALEWIVPKDLIRAGAKVGKNLLQGSNKVNGDLNNDFNRVGGILDNNYNKSDCLFQHENKARHIYDGNNEATKHFTIQNGYWAELEKSPILKPKTKKQIFFNSLTEEQYKLYLESKKEQGEE